MRERERARERERKSERERETRSERKKQAGEVGRADRINPVAAEDRMRFPIRPILSLRANHRKI